MAGDAERKLPLDGGRGRAECDRLAERFAALGHKLLADFVGGFRGRDEHELLQVARVVALVQQLLANEDDAGTAQPEALTVERLGHLLLAVPDERHGVALDADAQPMPPADEEEIDRGEIPLEKDGPEAIFPLTFRRSSARQSRR